MPDPTPIFPPSPSLSVPVVFNDGEREINIGNIGFHPCLDFDKLLSIVSQNIGIAPHQISLSIICRKKSRTAGTRKIPIYEKVNFGSILEQERDCYFLATLKTSRRGGRNRKHQDYFAPSGIESLQKRFLIDPPQILLRRDSKLGFRDYENQLRIQKENYLMSINPYPYSVDKFGFGFGRGGDCTGNNSTAVCEVCCSGNGKVVPFHWCVYDRTTVGFRSPAGPIARPSKG